MFNHKRTSLIFVFLLLQGCASSVTIRTVDSIDELRKRWNFSYVMFLGGLQEMKLERSDVVQKFGGDIKNIESSASVVNSLLQSDKTTTQEFTKVVKDLCNYTKLMEKNQGGFPSIEITTYMSDISLMVGYLAEFYQPNGCLLKECEYAVWK